MPSNEKQKNSDSVRPLLALSWGCGVQSTALAVMSALGDLSMLDVVITADTGWERRDTYRAREFYTAWLEERSVHVCIVSAGSVKVQGAVEHVHVPFFTETGAPLRRQCTRHFKVVPIKHELRRLMGYDPVLPPHPRPGALVQWLGISLDEYQRMKPSRVRYIVHEFPLVEKRLTRNDCIEYLEDKGLPVPIKSACIGCPYRRASEWLEMKESSPDEWAEVVAFDESNRDNPLAGRDGSTADRLYVYQKSVPLVSADLVRDANRERKSVQLPLICDSGYCHV